MATTMSPDGGGGGGGGGEHDADPFDLAPELRRAPRPAPGRPSAISEFYRNRNVLITGASGFIGKVLIEKLLRTCPGVGKIYVLVRPKRGKQPGERVRELLESHLFDGVRSGERLDARVLVLEGDVTQENLGLSGQNLARVLKDVSVIFHSAATVKFDEPLKQSVAINIAGTKNMINLCRRIPHLAGLVHVSTAYANCNIDSVDEHVYPVDMDPERLIQMADWLDQDTLQELKRRLLGARPNTYTYTKALAEWLLVRSARDLPLVICRPSIVVASSSEPFRGWIDNMNGPTGVVLGAGKGLIRSMYAENACVADLVPVDKVINLVVALGWFAHRFRAANRAAEHERQLEDSLTDSLIGSSACSSSSAAGSSAASTSGESLAEREAEAQDEDENEIYDQAQVGREGELVEQLQEESSASGVDSHFEARDDGYGSRSSRCAGSLASRRPTLTSLARRQRQPSDGSSSSSSSGDGGAGCKQAARQTDETTTTTTTTTATNCIPAILTDATQGSGLTTTNLCDTQQAAVRRRRRRSYGAAQQQQQQQRQQLKTQQQKQRQQQQQHKQHKLQRTTVDKSSLSSEAQAELEYKLRQFRQRTRAKLMAKGLDEELAEIPVFHCTSGSENPITWGQVQLFILAALAIFPSASTYRYPCGSFTNNERLDNFYRITLHYIPGYIVDFFTRLLGGKPIIVRLFRKFDQAAHVLKAFTSRDWHFSHDNRLFLMRELMSDEDRRLFDCDVAGLNWREFCLDYVVGVRKFLLKEPMANLASARKNLRLVYYRNLSIQLVMVAAAAYGAVSTIGLMNSYYNNHA